MGSGGGFPLQPGRAITTDYRSTTVQYKYMTYRVIQGMGEKNYLEENREIIFGGRTEE